MHLNYWSEKARPLYNGMGSIKQMLASNFQANEIEQHLHELHAPSSDNLEIDEIDKEIRTRCDKISNIVKNKALLDAKTFVIAEFIHESGSEISKTCERYLRQWGDTICESGTFTSSSLSRLLYLIRRGNISSLLVDIRRWGWKMYETYPGILQNSLLADCLLGVFHDLHEENSGVFLEDFYRLGFWRTSKLQLSDRILESGMNSTNRMKLICQASILGCRFTNDLEKGMKALERLLKSEDIRDTEVVIHHLANTNINLSPDRFEEIIKYLNKDNIPDPSGIFNVWVVFKKAFGGDKEYCQKFNKMIEEQNTHARLLFIRHFATVCWDKRDSLEIPATLKESLSELAKKHLFEILEKQFFANDLRDSTGTHLPTQKESDASLEKLLLQVNDHTVGGSNEQVSYLLRTLFLALFGYDIDTIPRRNKTSALHGIIGLGEISNYLKWVFEHGCLSEEDIIRTRSQAAVINWLTDSAKDTQKLDFIRISQNALSKAVDTPRTACIVLDIFKKASMQNPSLSNKVFEEAIVPNLKSLLSSSQDDKHKPFDALKDILQEIGKAKSIDSTTNNTIRQIGCTLNNFLVHNVEPNEIATRAREIQKLCAGILHERF